MFLIFMVKSLENLQAYDRIGCRPAHSTQKRSSYTQAQQQHRQHKMPYTLPPYDSLGSILADEIPKPHPDFSAHPFHQAKLSNRIQTPQIPHTLVTTATLAETISVFSGPHPPNHTTVMLHKSQHWEEDHIDDRYAETQSAFNGTHYRDWVSMYRSGQDHSKSRLSSHHIQITQLFHTHFPISQNKKHT
jgi:hypothetical protein